MLRLPRPDLVVVDPWPTVARFFAGRRSSYDEYVAGGASPRDRITHADVSAINAFGARSPQADWASLIKRGRIPQLAGLPADLNLFLTPEAAWKRAGVSDRLRALFGVVVRRGIGIARATKMLHIKRPALIPVCDSEVMALLDIPDTGAASGVALVEHLRLIRRDVRPTLLELQRRLRARGRERTLVRIMDALILSARPRYSG